ncbi:unnamed protein product [Penicillium bialowiezense]
MTRREAQWGSLHVDGLLQATDRDLEPMAIRRPRSSYSLECKDDATSFSLLLLRPVPGRPEVVLDDPLPEGGILLNIFGVPHGSREPRLTFFLFEPRYDGNGRTNSFTASMVSHLSTAKAQQAGAFIIFCPITSHASNRVARFFKFAAEKTGRSLDCMHVAVSVCPTNERALSADVANIASINGRSATELSRKAAQITKTARLPLPEDVALRSESQGGYWRSRATS